MALFAELGGERSVVRQPLPFCAGEFNALQPKITPDAATWFSPQSTDGVLEYGPELSLKSYGALL
jgi:hypothetical protein